jgi:hypothetical protein
VSGSRHQLPHCARHSLAIRGRCLVHIRKDVLTTSQEERRNRWRFLALAALVSAILAGVWMSFAPERRSASGSVGRFATDFTADHYSSLDDDVAEFARNYQAALKKAQERKCTEYIMSSDPYLPTECEKIELSELDCMILTVSRSPYAHNYCEKKATPAAKFVTTERKLSTEGVPLPRSRPY